MRSFRRGAALLGVLVVLLAGCAKQGVEPQEWASRVCQALGPWTQEISKLTSQTQQEISKATSPKQAKRTIVGLLEGAEKASERARQGVKAAGVPAVDNGERIAEEFRKALRAARDSYKKAHNAVRQLSTKDADAFYDGVVDAMEELSKDYNAGALDTDRVSSEELQRAFDESPDCQG